MKKIYLLLSKSLLAGVICTMFTGCDEGSVEIPYYEFSRVSKCERDSVATLMTYGDKGLSQFSVLVRDSLVCKSNVKYSSSSIVCTIHGTQYDIQLSNTKGGVRAESILATKNSARQYYVVYRYDSEGRLVKADIEGVADRVLYTHYRYEGNTVIIDDVGTEFQIHLSSEENAGYVCNVLDYADAPYTSTYVINPDLYFLNIYGAPIDKLPHGHDVEFHNTSSKLLRVGKYSYEYHD